MATYFCHYFGYGKILNADMLTFEDTRGRLFVLTPDMKASGCKS
jgi:hypothetical protein